MSFEASIYAALKTLVSNRVYRDIAPDNITAYPFITFQQVGGQALTYLEAASPSKKNARVQVNCWGGPEKVTDRDTISALGRDVEDAMTAAVSSSFVAKPMSALVARFDEETKRFGTMQDFSVWFDD